MSRSGSLEDSDSALEDEEVEEEEEEEEEEEAVLGFFEAMAANFADTDDFTKDFFETSWVFFSCSACFFLPFTSFSPFDPLTTATAAVAFIAADADFGFLVLPFVFLSFVSLTAAFNGAFVSISSISGSTFDAAADTSDVAEEGFVVVFPFGALLSFTASAAVDAGTTIGATSAVSDVGITGIAVV